MSYTLCLSPGGRLILESRAVDADTGVGPSAPEIAGLAAAFHESTASGLIRLAHSREAENFPPDLVYWRGFARRAFAAICRQGEAEPAHWTKVPAPAEGELSELVATAPPMRGLEYLDIPLLQRLWSELVSTAAQQATDWKHGPSEYLQHVDPAFHQLGRVTFHLAENKRDPHRPFAFLATFTHRLTDQSKVAHIPLAEALKESARAKDTTRLKSLLEPVEHAAGSSPLVAELLDSKSLFAPQAWTIGEAYRFLQDVPKMEEAGLIVRVPNWWSTRRPPRPRVQIRIGKQAPGGVGFDGILDFDVSLTLEGESLTEEERARLLASTERLVLLRGKWIEVDRERLNQAISHWKKVARATGDGIEFIQGMRLLAGAALDTGEPAAAGQVAEWSDVVAGDWLHTTLKQMRSPDEDPECQPGRDLQATLRPYQVTGVHWLWFMTRLSLGGCLADDMGLGKTIQVIDLLLQRQRVAGRTAHTPSLLIVPASLLGNWRQELTRFAPALSVLMLHRSECDTETMTRVADNPAQELADYDLVVTTYGLVRRQSWLASITWSLIVLDEAQAIKNAGSTQTRSIKALPARARLVLTGTPVENDLGDLWSLFDFACPGLLSTAGDFKKYIKRLNAQHDPDAYAGLRRLVRPYILRRLKTDPAIVPDLPHKTELRVECGLVKKQAVMYEQAVKDLARRLKETDGMERRGLVLATLMQLKQICNHPSQHLQQPDYPAEESGKFERLRLLCEPIVERQERALVFTQFQSLTEPLANWLRSIFGRPGLVLHGGTPVKKRSELVRSFQSEEGPPFFVISLKAGGSGLNLTAASHVVHFDRWWNPAVENQATDRAFRIGQRRNVMVHKFVCRGTIEERIDALIASKQQLADQVLGPGADVDLKLTEMDDGELLNFVRLDLRRALDEE